MICFKGSSMIGICVAALLASSIRISLAAPAPEEARAAAARTVERFSNAPEDAYETASGRPLPVSLREFRTPAADTAEIILEFADFPETAPSARPVTPLQIARLGYALDRALEPFGYSRILLYVWDPSREAEIPCDRLFPEETGAPAVQDEAPDDVPAERIKAERARTGYRPVALPGQIQGSLTGKTVYLNAGHGWFDDVDFGRWRVQRGIVADSTVPTGSMGILEDFSNPEMMNLYLIPYLLNAGATVLTVREMDHQTRMVIVDNEDGASNPSNGTYVETGTWSDSTLRGFKQKTTASWTGTSVNPFNNGGINRLAVTNPSGVTATARWTPNIPADGYYWVYVSWSRYSGRSTQAQYIVRHTGGATEIRVNQTKYGFIWYPIGQFYFRAGSHPETGSVELTNYAATGDTVSADAVRFGGGMGDTARQTHGVSGRPRFEEEAVNYLQWNGFGSSGFLYTGVDDEAGGWADRPQFAQWMDAYDGDSVYMAHHTNAGGGTGTRSYLHESASAASAALRDAIHDELVNDIKAGWNANWSHYKKSGNYGENSQSNLGSVPGFLMETLFHDSSSDTAAYRDPRFRDLMGRAFAQGFIRYFAQRDGVTLTYPPEPPTHLRVLHLGSGRVQVSWQAPPSNTGNGLLGDPATGYRVFRSTDGRGFDSGVAVSQTSYILEGLSAGSLHYFRVCATNAGGWSMPTETLAIRLPAAGESAPQAILVNAFDRNDNALPPWENVTNTGSLPLIRVESWRFQSFDYTIQHAEALAGAGVSFDGASNEAVADSLAPLAAYRAVFWICGEESTADETFSGVEQTRIRNFLAQPGRGLFTSGAEIAWDLDFRGGVADKTFINSHLYTAYAADDANTYQAAGAASGPFQGLATFNFSTSQGAPYDAETPDTLTPSAPAIAAMTYVGGTGGTAATAYDGGASGYRVILLGFPFETIGSLATRIEIMSRAATFFQLSTVAPPTLTPGPTPSPTPPPTPTPGPTATFLVENFEPYTAATRAMFQDPGYSGSTRGIDLETDASEVSTAAANPLLPPAFGATGTKAHRFIWTWTEVAGGIVRCTTNRAAQRPNPLLDLSRGLSLYIKLNQGELDLALWIRETGVEGTIGSDAGTTGQIEEFGETRRIVGDGRWRYLYFDLPAGPWITVTGDGALQTRWGALESLVFRPTANTPSGSVEIFVDDIWQGPSHVSNNLAETREAILGRRAALWIYDTNTDGVVDAADLIRLTGN